MDHFNIAQQHLLNDSGIDVSHLQRALSVAMAPKSMDFADVYLQSTHFESWGLEDGIVKQGSHSIEQGFGLRAISGEKTGFSYSQEISDLRLQEAANTARAIVSNIESGSHCVAITSQVKVASLYSAENPLNAISVKEKIALLHRLDQLARQTDPSVMQVMVSLSGVHEMMLVLNSDGVLAADVRPLVRLQVSVIAEKNGRREQGSVGGGGRVSYKIFLENKTAEHYVKEAVREALVNLEAKPAPAGTMTVVLGSGWPGILLHEAIGHGLEADFNRKGASAFANRLGEQVAAKGCTVVDDGTIANRRGSLSFDDEGTPTQCTTLIEDGILKGYLQDQQNSRLMKMKLTGNGRRESFAHLPMPRMTNTYMLAGQHDPQEMIASVKDGLYAVNFAGGQVDITSGKFVFSASEAYRIENGKVTYPVRGATLIGNGPDVLTKVSMIGNDLKLDPGVGTCGKEGQSVPVGVGLPTLRIDAITVGGTQQ